MARRSMPQTRMGVQHFLGPQAMVNLSKLLFPKTNKLTWTHFWLLILSLFDCRTKGNRKIPHRTWRGGQCHKQGWEYSTSWGRKQWWICLNSYFQRQINSHGLTFGFLFCHFSTAGRTEIVKFLIEHGADVNATTKDGETPLLEAAKNGEFI